MSSRKIAFGEVPLAKQASGNHHIITMATPKLCERVRIHIKGSNKYLHKKLIISRNKTLAKMFEFSIFMR